MNAELYNPDTVVNGKTGETVSSSKIHIYCLRAAGIQKAIHWATSAPMWPEVAPPRSSLFISSNLTWQLLLHLFSFYNPKLKRNRSRWMARDRLIYGRDWLFFSTAAVKCAACWHSKPQKTTITNQSPVFPCFHLLPKHRNRPLPCPAIIPLMNQRHWSRCRERQALGTASPFFSLSLSHYCSGFPLSLFFFRPLSSLSCIYPSSCVG